MVVRRSTRIQTCSFLTLHVLYMATDRFYLMRMDRRISWDGVAFYTVAHNSEITNSVFNDANGSTGRIKVSQICV